MYFPPLVWSNIRDYLGIWENIYNKVVKDLPKSNTISRFPTPVGFYYTDDGELGIVQRQIRETSLLKNQRGYNIATYWIEPYIRHHNRVMRP